MNAELESSIQRAVPSALKMALYAAKKQNYEILKYTLESIDSLSSNASMLKEYAEQEHMDMLESTTKEFVVLDAQLNAYKAQLEKMDAAVESGRITTTDFDKLVKASTAKPKVNFTKHEAYKRFCERAGIAIDGDNDEDVVVQDSESSRSTTCPVTQMEMKTPLRNPSCGHTYDEKGIQSHLKRNKKCPVAGCPHTVSAQSLERDVEMEILIARRKNSAQQSSQHPASVPSFRADDDDEEEEEYVVE